MLGRYAYAVRTRRSSSVPPSLDVMKTLVSCAQTSSEAYNRCKGVTTPFLHPYRVLPAVAVVRLI